MRRFARDQTMLKPEAAASGTINQSEPYEIHVELSKRGKIFWHVTGFLLVVNWWKKRGNGSRDYFRQSN